MRSPSSYGLTESLFDRTLRAQAAGQGLTLQEYLTAVNAWADRLGEDTHNDHDPHDGHGGGR